VPPTLTQIVERILAFAKPVSLVAIDGRGGAGKSTLAEQLRAQLPDATVVHTDDFYHVMDPAVRAALSLEEAYQQNYDWQRLERQVLGPISQGKPAHYQRYDWGLNELAETIVLSLIIFLLMRQVVQNYRIESHSMEPNFSEGQFILVNKLAYVLGEPQRGDVLVFHNPNNPDEDYIKRIIGLPGDTFAIADQQVYINSEAMGEPYIQNPIRPNETYPPQVIEPDHLFVMGDNRPNSSDSRRFGQLPQDLVVGKAWLRVWPPDQWGLVGHEDPILSTVQAAGP